LLCSGKQDAHQGSYIFIPTADVYKIPELVTKYMPIGDIHSDNPCRQKAMLSLLSLYVNVGARRLVKPRFYQ